MKIQFSKYFSSCLARASALTLVGTLAGLAACGVPLEEESMEVVGAQPEALTTLTLENGAQVRFFEPEAGKVFTVTTGEIEHVSGAIEPVALYEKLSGTTAPAVLVEAQRRAVIANQQLLANPIQNDEAAQVVEPALPGPVVVNGIGVSQQGLSSTDFTNQYCGAGLGPLNFDYCWTNRTANYSIEIKSVDWIHSHANALTGSFVMSTYYKNTWGNWILLVSDTVSGSSTVVTQSTFSNNTYKVSLTQATGDTYHLAIHGEK